MIPMANTLHGMSIDRTSTTSSKKSQGPFLNKLKSGLAKFISRRRHSSIVDTFRPNKHEYVPARQDSFSDNDDHHHCDEQDDSEDDLDGISDIGLNNELLHSMYSKDDDVERMRYHKATCYQHQRNQLQAPTILVKRSSSHHRYTNSLQNSCITTSSASQHRYTNSLQSSSVISVPGSNNSSKPTQYHHSRHHSHISFMSTSNMTVNSEDLTAKEFADMAGIRIIPDSDDTGDQPDDMATTSTSMATSLTPGGHQQRPSYCSNQPSNETDWSVVSSGSQNGSTSAAKIWDTEFWRPAQQQQPVLKKHRSAILQHRQTLSLPSPMTATVPSQHLVNSQSNCDFPIIHELRRIHSTSNNNNQQHVNNNTHGDPCVIRKGRFEIQLEP